MSALPPWSCHKGILFALPIFSCIVAPNVQGSEECETGPYCVDGACRCDSNHPYTDGECLVCGNGMVDPGEECDSEPGCNTETCTFIDTCGDGMIQAGEECDSGDGCRPDCTCNDGYDAVSGGAPDCEAIVANLELPSIVFTSATPSILTLPGGGSQITVTGRNLYNSAWSTVLSVSVTVENGAFTDFVPMTLVGTPTATSFVFAAPNGTAVGYAALRVRHAAGYTKLPSRTRTDLVYYFDGGCISVGQWSNPDDECVACPTGAYCPGGDRIWPRQGYWSPDEYSQVGVFGGCV